MGSRTDRNQLFDRAGNLVSETTAVIDTTTVDNLGTLQSRAQTALTTNSNYLALGTAVTNAQVAAQVSTLTKENTAVIRILLGLLDSTAGT